ncbi:MAG: hypothetical protein SPI97_05355, partial [Oscillospiraceae bacterium]|nr:hypothetical protein [Oscillospiraceae bacterium]
MKFVGITQRWFFNVASIVILILVTVSLALIFSLKNYYYGVAEMTLDSYSADEIASTFNLSVDSNSGGFETAGRKFIESFPEKDKMAVWIIDSTGKVILS